MKKLLLVSLCMLLLSVMQTYAQNRTVTGVVKGSDDGMPIPGTTVKVKGTSTGTQTGANGRYRLSVPATGAVLVFSSIGYTSQEIVVGSRENIDVVLAVSANQLGEVQIVAAGGLVTRQRAQGYNTTRIDSTQLTAGKATSVAAGLIGKVAGLQINTVSSGVNPTVRVVLRGNRSVTGNNQALIVLDNIIVPNIFLNTINPEDIESIQVLNGAGAAALYGSVASNGAILIITKKGKKNSPARVYVANTTNLEQISYYPKLQNGFGSGSTPNAQVYTPFENQQYGPAFDGQPRIIGRPLQDGSIQTIPYSATRDKYDFWNTGVTNQTDFSITSGTDKSSLYLSGQYVGISGTTPDDKANRTSFRVNGVHEFTDNLKLTYNTNYISQRFDVTTATSSVYDNLLNTPAQIPLLRYKNVNSDPFANQNGYYNEYYQNPYFAISNNRGKERNDYLFGALQLDWTIKPWVTLTGRTGITTRNQSIKNSQGKFTYTDYTKSISSSKTDVPGGVTDLMYYNNNLYTDLYATFRKDYKDIFFNLTTGGQITNVQSKSLSTQANGLVIPGLYNVSNRVGEATPGESNFGTHTQSLYYRFQVGYKDFLYLTTTGRNDWTSLLAKDNRSFFYPEVDVAYVPTSHLSFLKDIKEIDQIRIFGSASRVGNVNVSPYALQAVFTPTGGFPFGNLGGYSVGNQTVSLSLRPEITKAYEAGLELSFYKRRIFATATWYRTNTVDQTLSVGVSRATGFSSYLANTGDVKNEGVESAITLVPLRTASGWEVTVGGNFTYNENRVISLGDGVDRLQLTTGSSAQIYAVKGGTSTMVLGTDYLRDNQGRIIVDPITGYPTQDPTIRILGNTTPKQRLGLNSTVSYKGFRLSALFEYRGGYVINQSIGSTLDFSGASYRSAVYNRERFVIPNSSIPDGRGGYVANTNVTVRDGGAEFWTNSSYNIGIASNYTVSGNYWKLREAALSYNFPDAMFRNSKYIKGAHVSVQGRNLVIWVPKSNLYTDPDYSFTDSNAVGISTLGQTPPTRFYSATLALNF